MLAAAAYGAFVALAGLMPSIWMVLVFFMLAGAADMISGVFRGTVWNQTIPENMRGRLAGIEMLSYSVGPLGGQVRAGITADLWGVRAAIVSGGVACVGGVAAHRGRAARLLVLRRAHRRARPRRARRPRRTCRRLSATTHTSARQNTHFGTPEHAGRQGGDQAAGWERSGSKVAATSSKTSHQSA